MRLKDIVSHREIILPQLAGPGVAANEVLKQSGFKVLYRPVQVFALSGKQSSIQSADWLINLTDRASLRE